MVNKAVFTALCVPSKPKKKLVTSMDRRTDNPSPRDGSSRLKMSFTRLYGVVNLSLRNVSIRLMRNMIDLVRNISPWFFFRFHRWKSSLLANGDRRENYSDLGETYRSYLLLSIQSEIRPYGDHVSEYGLLATRERRRSRVACQRRFSYSLGSSL